MAELVGYGPVAISVIRDMIDTGDPFLTAVATRDVDVVGVAHLGRRPTAHQRTALEWLYPTCAVEVAAPWPGWRWTIVRIGRRPTSHCSR
ncbi:MAG: hypothetical protein M3137_03645 [Actinomycetota bacterium]|nr:hypothetical protein [Actinomycetota bacterium]